MNTYRNFYDIVRSNAQKKPKSVVLFIDDEKVKNIDLLQSVDKFAAYLEHIGVKESNKVAIVASNSFEFVITIFAVSKIGAVLVPVNNMLKAKEIEFILDDCGAVALVGSGKFKKELALVQKNTNVKNTIWIDSDVEENETNIKFENTLDIEKTSTQVERKLEDLALIFYTSGTTGNPKGAMISNKNILSNLEQITKRLQVTSKDRFITFLPMFHAFTFTCTVMEPIYASASTVIIKNLMPFKNIIKQSLLKRVTVFLGVPDIYNALVRAKLPWYFLWFNSLRIFISGGSALNEDTYDKFRKVFPRALMTEGYGLSETSPVACVNPLDKQKLMSVGLPLDTYEFKIVDSELVEVPLGQDGEIIIKGDCVMMGYLNNEQASKDSIINGWFRTGDIGKMDEDGYVYVVDRIKDLIISKGINVYPRQIEEEINQYPEVKASAVVGQKDSNSGEIPIAFVELEEGENSLDEAELKKRLKANLANFKIPKHIHFIDELPKNATGKVLKRVLKEQIRNGEI